MPSLDSMIRPEEDTRVESDLEELVWSPHHPLPDKAIDQFLVLARSVGTFARAVDAASTLKQPRCGQGWEGCREGSELGLETVMKATV